MLIWMYARISIDKYLELKWTTGSINKFATDFGFFFFFFIKVRIEYITIQYILSFVRSESIETIEKWNHQVDGTNNDYEKNKIGV